MKFKLETSVVKQMLNNLNPVISRTSTLPILSNIFIQGRGNKIDFQGTNLEIFIKTSAELQEHLESDFSVLLDFQKLSKIATTTSADNIEFNFEPNGDKILLKAGKTKHNLILESADGFPEYEEKFESEIQRMRFEPLSKLIPATCKNDFKKDMEGILFTNGELVATDGFRLALYRYSGIKFNDIIIPLNLAKVLSTLKGEYNVVTNENAIKIYDANYFIISKLINEPFPKYKSVIPPEFSGEFEFNRNELLQAIKSVGFNAEEKTKKIIFTMNDAKDELFVKAEDVEKGIESETTLEVKATEDISFGMNEQFLSECLNSFDEEILKFQYNAPNKAFLINTEKLLYLLMPIKVG